MTSLLLSLRYNLTTSCLEGAIGQYLTCFGIHKSRVVTTPIVDSYLQCPQHAHWLTYLMLSVHASQPIPLIAGFKHHPQVQAHPLTHESDRAIVVTVQESHLPESYCLSAQCYAHYRQPNSTHAPYTSIAALTKHYNWQRGYDLTFN